MQAKQDISLHKGAKMARKRSKQVSFNAMVKFFMQYYSIPTKRDVDKMTEQLNRIEQMLKNLMSSAFLKVQSSSKTRKTAVTASDTVLKAIKKSGKGVSMAEIQAQTGFDEKKLRNLIYRLNKTGRIKRIRRGIYGE
jgi:hypothetical protein